MLGDIGDQIEEVDQDEVDETKELEDRLDILRGEKPRNKKEVNDDAESTLVTLPLKDVEELRQKLRNLEEINENLSLKLKEVEEIKAKSRHLEDTNQKLAHKVKDLEEKKNGKEKEAKKTKEQAREESIVIEMETNDEAYDLSQLIQNKESGYSRSSPQNEAQKKTEVFIFDCSGCEKKFIKRENMMSHQKTHEVICELCEKLFSNNKKLQEHMTCDHDEMICHIECEGGKCARGGKGSPQIIDQHKCNFCEMFFSSKNALSVHRSDTHRSYKPCRDIINCQYQSGCYFSHMPITVGKVRCYQCGEEFTSKHTMMIHRKIHGGVKECSKLIGNECNRGDSCWWSHVTTSNQVFQQVKENLPPPIQRKEQLEAMKPQEEILQNPNEILVNMLKTMDTELKKIKQMLNIN